MKEWTDLTYRFLYGLRVEVRTTKELMAVMRYLEKRMPHWYRERWHYDHARPRTDMPCIGMGNEKSAFKIVNGACVVAQFPKNENTLSFAEFITESRKRGPYKPRKKVQP